MSSNPDKAESTKQRKRGRPTLSEQAELKKQIYEYFEEGISPLAAEMRSGIDRKTVRKHYLEFAEHRLRIDEDEFNEQCKINLASAELTISNRILKLRRYEDEQEIFFEPRIKSNNISPRDYLNLQRERRKYAKTITDLIVLRTHIANSPTADITLNRLVQEWIQKIAA